MTIEEIEQMILEWSLDRGIIDYSTSQIQTLKAVSEMGELADAVAKGEPVDDHIGDIIVCLTNIAYMNNTNLEDCIHVAWNDIKDRKGKLSPHGSFIKDEPVTSTTTQPAN